MKNLLSETKEFIASNDLSIDDIQFIGSKDGEYGCTWDEFEQISDFTYDEGFGVQYIASDLIIVFSCGAIMFRDEYDGAESWSVVRPRMLWRANRRVKRLRPIKKLEGWLSISQIHDDDF